MTGPPWLSARSLKFDYLISKQPRVRSVCARALPKLLLVGLQHLTVGWEISQADAKSTAGDHPFVDWLVATVKLADQSSKLADQSSLLRSFDCQSFDPLTYASPTPTPTSSSPLAHSSGGLVAIGTRAR